MRNLLLLVQTPADVEALPAATQEIKHSNVRGVWLLLSPAIIVDQKAAAATFDKDIADLEAAEQAAAGRRDYDGARGYAAQRDAKQLDRAKALRDAWKSVSADDRDVRIKNIVRPIMDELNPRRDETGTALKVSELQDHWEPENWIAMLNSLTAGWFKPFAPGTFFVAWPGVVAAVLKDSPTSQLPPVPPPPTPEQQKEYNEAVAKSAPPSPPPMTLTRREELENTARSIRVSIAAKLGVEGAPKMTGPELTEAILAAEAKKTAVAEPALNEY